MTLEGIESIPKRSLRSIILRPIWTEKVYEGVALNKYTFEVDLKASKSQIKRAIQTIFKVTVLKINTVKMRGKSRRRGRYIGRTSDWKKAVVTLKTGEKIELGGIDYFEQ